ncbi:MAG: hypothetical protein PVI91_12825 [Gammaproteobacteria bacterium]|jgi:hypothetical protein
MHLSVPSRTAPGSGSFDSRPAAVQTWIDHLPMGEVGHSSRLLFEALTELNQQDIPARQRFRALEMLREPVRFVTDRLQTHFVSRPLPLAPRNLLVAQLSREITHLMATGYKILVTEQLAGIGRGDGELLITAIHRATRLLSAVLLKAYQVYEPYPDCVWLEIHSLYRFAEENALHRTEVTDGWLKRARASTVADAYKQILLLALACPYRLRQDEAAHIYEALEQWAPRLQLRPVEETCDALFVSDLDSDQPPTYLVLSQAGANRHSCRALDATPLADQLRNLAGRRGGAAGPGLGDVHTQTLRRLMLAWGVMPKRRYTRVQGSSEVMVTIGLSSIHYFVSGEVAFNAKAEPAQGCPEHSRSTGAPEPGRRPRNEPRENRARRGGARRASAVGSSVAGETVFPGARIDTRHSARSWKMVDVSAGGYRLLWDNPEATNARVGELLGIREPSDPDSFHWRLGVIRWLKSSGKPGIQLGVEMLSPGAVAIAARPETGKATDTHDTRGLLLPHIDGIEGQATLLLASSPFKPGSTVVAECQGKRIRVRLTKLIENTGRFAQFQFLPLGELGQVRERRSPGTHRPLDIKDIWSFL